MMRSGFTPTATCCWTPVPGENPSYWQVSDFHPDQSFFLHEGEVFTEMWTAHPGSGGIAAVLVLEFTADYVDFLAAKVAVWYEALSRRPLYQRHLLAAVLAALR